jgi:hypothetical protein
MAPSDLEPPMSKVVPFPLSPVGPTPSRTYRVKAEWKDPVNRRKEAYFPERMEDQDSKRAIVADILTGDLEGVIEVLEIYSDVPARDIIEEVALEVLKDFEGYTHDDNEHTRQLRNWLHEHLGPDFVETALVVAGE